MRVNLNNLAASESAQTAHSSGRASQSAPRGVNSESATADQLSAASLSRTVAELPEVRQEKVAALAEKLRTGEYQVSAHQTADAIVSQMRERKAA